MSRFQMYILLDCTCSIDFFRDTAACLSSMNYMLSFLIACHRVHVDIMVKFWCFFSCPPSTTRVGLK